MHQFQLQHSWPLKHRLSEMAHKNTLHFTTTASDMIKGHIVILAKSWCLDTQTLIRFQWTNTHRKALFTGRKCVNISCRSTAPVRTEWTQCMEYLKLVSICWCIISLPPEEHKTKRREWVSCRLLYHATKGVHIHSYKIIPILASPIPVLAGRKVKQVKSGIR